MEFYLVAIKSKSSNVKVSAILIEKKKKKSIAKRNVSTSNYGRYL